MYKILNKKQPPRIYGPGRLYKASKLWLLL